MGELYQSFIPMALVRHGPFCDLASDRGCVLAGSDHVTFFNGRRNGGFLVPARAACPDSQPVEMLGFRSSEDLVLNLLRSRVSLFESERQTHIAGTTLPECDSGDFQHLVDMLEPVFIFYFQAEHD